MSNAGLTHMGRKRRDVHGEPMPTETRPCLRCRKPSESEGVHHRLCGPCVSFIAAAIEAGDVPTVVAVLHAQPFLSGLEPATHETLQARAAAKFAPVDNAQLEATEATLVPSPRRALRW